VKRSQCNDLADLFAETRDPNVRVRLDRCLSEQGQIEAELRDCVAANPATEPGPVIYNPNRSFDFMSYCAPQWISPYHYVALKNDIATSFASFAATIQEQDVEREYLGLRFIVYRDGRVELLPSFHLRGPARPSQVGQPSPIRCELLGEDGQVLVSHACHLFDPYQEPDGPELRIAEVIPWEPGVRSIAFLRDGEEISRIEVEEEAPTVTEMPQVTRRRRRGEESLVEVEWQAETPGDAPAYYMLRYSNDGGSTWRVLTPPSEQPSLAVDLSLLPGGEECKFQVVASTNIRTATAETEPLAVEQKPRVPNIVSPEPDATFLEGEPVVLLGDAFSPDFGTPDLEELVWRSNLDGVIDVGPKVITQELSVGQHRIILSVPDGLGGEAAASVPVTITGGP
jgi:hypothetical protein